jgi:hypothetical protein
MFLTFGGTVKIALILRLIFWGYLGKVIYEVVATPLTYAIVKFLKRTEGVDVYDTHTDFNPFSKEKKGERDVALVNAAVTAVGQD